MDELPDVPEVPEVPEVPDDEPDDDGELVLPDDAPEPLDMPELDVADEPVSLVPEEEWVPVELHAANEAAQASITIHLDIHFSF